MSDATNRELKAACQRLKSLFEKLPEVDRVEYVQSASDPTICWQIIFWKTEAASQAVMKAYFVNPEGQGFTDLITNSPRRVGDFSRLV